jgi:hypothetical protein
MDETTLTVVTDNADDLPDVVADALDSVPWEAERYDVGACASTGRSGESHPWEGMSVWLTPFEAPMGLLEAGTGLSSGDNASVASGFPRLRGGLAEVVVAHDLRNPSTGELYQQVWHNPDALLAWPSSLLFHVWSLAVSGEPADARPKGSQRTRGGSSTRRPGGKGRSGS